MSPRCDLYLEDSKQFLFRVTLWLILQHHHTMFGNKMFCGLEDSIRTIFTDNVNLRCDLDLERSNPIFFPQDTLAYNAVLSNRVWLQADQQFGRCSRNSHILIKLALAVILTLTVVNFFFLPDNLPRDNTPQYQV